VNGRAELISQAEYARRRDVAKSAVAKAVREGRITLINGKIDPAVADIQWAQNTRARIDSGRAAAVAPPAGVDVPAGAETASEAPASSVPGEDYQAIRIRRERAQLEAAERENAIAAGRLVERDAAERGTFDVFRALRDAAMNTCPRAAAKVVGMSDVRDIERVFTGELRVAFESAEPRLLEHLKGKAHG